MLSVDRPGRIVRMSASGLTSLWLMLNAVSSRGAATQIGPDHERPGAAWVRPALGDSSVIMLAVPRSAAICFATFCACAMLTPGGTGPFGPLQSPGHGAYTMSWLELRFGPA